MLVLVRDGVEAGDERVQLHSPDHRLPRMAKRKESHGEIDWASAEVKDSALTVPLAGEPSKAWAERAAEVVDRLGDSGGWGAIEVTKERVTVEAVQPGSEADLRHLLEGAVMQANADFAPTEQPAGDGEEPDEADGEMTGAFRAFADGGEDDGDDVQ